MRPTANVSSASVSSMRRFQKRRLSGNPSRSRGPGSSSRKKSASAASKERKPLGTMLTGWVCQVGVFQDFREDAEVPEGVDGGGVSGALGAEPTSPVAISD